MKVLIQISSKNYWEGVCSIQVFFIKGEDMCFVEELRKSACTRVKFLFEPDREMLESLYQSSLLQCQLDQRMRRDDISHLKEGGETGI